MMFFKNATPLYIVSRNGKEIQELFAWIQDNLEKQGIGPLLDILKTLFDILKAQICSYALLMIFEDLLAKLATLLKDLMGIFPGQKQ